MTIKAKSILKDKFWIIEKDGKRLGTFARDEDRFMYSTSAGTQVVKSRRNLLELLDSGNIQWTDAAEPKDKELEIYGYSTSCTPYCEMLDLKRHLPLFKKSDKSASLYAAGYYIIAFEKGWLKAFCPKLLTLESYGYRGPFKTKLEMKEELKHVKKRTT